MRLIAGLLAVDVVFAVRRPVAQLREKDYLEVAENWLRER